MNKPENFRDLADVQLPHGKIKANRLLRSGQVIGLSDADKNQLLGTHGLKTIVDFRTASETADYPDDHIPGVEYFHIDVMKTAEDKVATLETSKHIADVDSAHTYMHSVYEAMILDAEAQSGYAEFIRRMAEQTEGALLFHCFAGKDRTGLGAAIILTILGAAREEILRDYLLTNTLRKQANARLIEKERANGMGDYEAQIMDAFLSVQKSYLAYAFEVAEKHFGGFDRFISDRLGVSNADRKTLCENYLE